MSGIIDKFGGSLTADVLNFNPDAIPAPDTLRICMTRGERRIADELHKEFGGFKRVTIDVDGERHEFSADSLMQMLESYEGVTAELDYVEDKSRWFELFGTPERAARTLLDMCKCAEFCDYCPLYGQGVEHCEFPDAKGSVLEWLRGDA